MHLRNLFNFLRERVAPYKPDPEKEAQMRAALDLLRKNTAVIVEAGYGIAAAKEREEIRSAITSLGLAVRR